MVADAFSRAPVWLAPEDADILACTVRVAMARSKPTDKNVANLTRKALEDKSYHAIYVALKQGKQPRNLTRNNLAQSASPAWNNLLLETELPRLICHMRQTKVPEDVKADLMQKIHASHTGETKTLALARSLYYWPRKVKSHDLGMPSM